MDLIGPFHRSARSYRFVLVLVDYATRYPEAVPLRTISAKSVAQTLFQVISRVGIPKEILTDQGTSFMSRTLRELYELLGIKSIRTSVYHPQTDGLVERLNKTLKSMIRKFINEDEHNWDHWLDPLLFAVREVPQVSTGFSPFELLFGRRPRGVLDLINESWEDGPSPAKNEIQYVLDLRAKLHTLGRLSRENLLQAQQRQQCLYDRGARFRQFSPGDKVLVLLPTSSSKLLAKWQGPFVVTRRVGDVDYEVARSDRGGATQIYHLNLLKLWREVETASLVSLVKERDELGPEVPNSIIPTSLPCDDHLTQAQRADVVALQQRFADVFSPLPGRTSLIEHHFVTQPGVTVRSRPYRLPEHKRKIVQRELAEMLRMGVIEESHSAWCSPIVLVATKDGSIRFCVDYRRVNEVSRFDAYPMPWVDELLDRLGTARFFTTLDLTKGYWQIPLSAEAREKTAFSTPYGLTDKMRADFSIMKDLSTHTRLTPEQREGRLNRFITNIQRNADAQAELDKWGLSFDNQLLNLAGRVLPVERIYQRSRSYDYNPWAADWAKEMRGLAVISAPPLNNWLLFHTRRNSNEASSLLQNLSRVSGPLGITMGKPVMIQYEDHQESLLAALRHSVGPQIEMVVVVLPNNRKDRYDSVKKFLCVDRPTPSQCVVARTLSRPQALMTIATKIALQMACKMGGELWSVEIPLKQLMIVGIDCYHDTAAGKRSIGALVASLNQSMSRWFSKCVLQHKGQEIMDELKKTLSAALKEYLRFNGCLPSRIIVYRDGVGDGQLHSVVNYEVQQIMDSIKSMGQDYNPKLSVVVVRKRISSRFFAHINGKVSNPPPGTIIDAEVTRPEWYDFYIVSQAVRSGSVSPTHYNVVYDTSGLKPDHMQRLTYKLCHMYYNWQGIIRVPAPCQYAHKLAFLVGQSIRKEPNMKLDDQLFYL
uniref:ribonuclease H n=2 Tax=Astatotilapia calliptera TaxID=8154 RepID=A0A3P8QWH1_ASTCA